MTEPGWRQTSEDDENDLIFCRPGGEMIGRVYLDNRVRHEDGYHWRWFYSNQTGHTLSRREAMLAVEEAYEAGRVENERIVKG